MTAPRRPAFTLFQLLLILALLALLFALLLPLIAKARQEAERARKLNNLKQLALACHNYAATNGGVFPPGNDDKHYSAAARLLPFLEQDNLYKLIDFTKAMDDPANLQVRSVPVKVFLSPPDPLGPPNKNYGPTNYLFSAGSKPALKDNDGLFYQDSKIKLPADIPDGTSFTLMIGETLKGDGGTKAVDVKRQHVRLKADALKDLKADAGVQDFKDDKNIAGDRCASWMDGRFLQGTFTATRLPNDARPDVDCGGAGGLSALRSLDATVAVAMCDGSTRLIKTATMKAELWKALATRNGGEMIPNDF
jgi:type II secretory pathway pseudopilin PulG